MNIIEMFTSMADLEELVHQTKKDGLTFLLFVIKTINRVHGQ